MCDTRYSGVMKSCAVCGLPMITRRSDAKTCSARCRARLSRMKLPDVLTSRKRWVRWAADKTPLSALGGQASSTNPATWTSYEIARDSDVGAGVGFVLNGDGIGCYDLDHCAIGGELTEAAREFLSGLDAFYVEWSPSGDGVHAWVWSDPAPGWRRTVNGLRVEFYTRGRYMTVTGRRL